QDRQGARADDPAVAAGAGGSGHRIVERRRLLLTSVAGVVALPRAAEAQHGNRNARIGYLSLNLAAADPRTREAFIEGLRKLGYIEGRNLLIEYRDAGGKPERFPLSQPSWLRSSSM